MKQEKKYPDCLSNNKDLNLAHIYKKHSEFLEIPELTTIYEIEKPVLLALNSLKETRKDVKDNLSQNILNGLFVLSVSHLEIMISDLLKKIVLLNSDGLNSFYKNDKKTENIKYEVSLDDIKKGNISVNLIESRIDKLGFKNIEILLNKLSDVLKFDFKIDIDNIIEIKETRNLLLHNNLVVNDMYLTKTRDIKRADKTGSILTLNVNYIEKSIDIIIETVEKIRNAINIKYGSYSLINLLTRLWDFTFSKSGIPVLIEDFWVINEKKDIIDGPIKPPAEHFGSSQKFFYEVWVAQRINGSITNFSLFRLDDRNIKKLLFLIDVFGHLRLTHW